MSPFPMEVEPINLKKSELSQDEQEEKEYERKKMMEEGLINGPAAST